LAQGMDRHHSLTLAEEMFFTTEGMGQSLILLGSAFQESEMYLSSQGFSLSMLSLSRTLLPSHFQTKYSTSWSQGTPGSPGARGHTELSSGAEPAAVGLICVPKAKDTQNNLKMYLCPSSHKERFHFTGHQI
uniref:Uncharacterized protein n=1 Tax=Cyanistes caeruleus TaxID=156563 RepID=A0A8C0UT07_CYACU